MARPSTTGMPYLVRRPGSLIFSYWRNLQPLVAKLLRGRLECPWAGKTVDLTGKAVVRVSLKTADSTLARQRWAIVHRRVEDLVADALIEQENGSAQPDARYIALTSEQIAAIAGQVRHDLLKEHDDAWVGDDRWHPMNMPGRREDMAARVANALKRRSLNWMDFDVVTEEIRPNDDPLNPKPKVVLVREDLGEITQRLRSNDVEGKLTRDSQRELGLAILRAQSAAFQDIEEREQGRSVVTPSRPVMPAQPEAKTVVKISDMFERWLKESTRDPKTTQDYKNYLTYFTDKFGDLPVTAITRDMGIEFGQMLRKFPKSRPTRMRNAHPDAIIKWGESNPKTKKLTKRSINNKALRPFSKMMELARAHGFIGHNPCVNIVLKGEKAEANEIYPFDDLDLERMIKSPVFAGPVERSAAEYGDELFWIPLIGLFTGARMEEIGQLRTADIKKDRMGIDYFHITLLEPEEDDDSDEDEAGSEDRKKVKTLAGRRTIPIHSTLIKLGLLDYVKEMRGRRHARLFPGLKAYRGRLTKNLSKSWAAYQDKYINKSVHKVFHSFRHTFNRALREAFVEEEYRKLLMGHAASSVNQSYGAGLSLEKLQILLERAIFPKVDYLAAKWR